MWFLPATAKRERLDHHAHLRVVLGFVAVKTRLGSQPRSPRFAAERQQYKSLGRPSAALAAMGHPRNDERMRVFLSGPLVGLPRRPTNGPKREN